VWGVDHPSELARTAFIESLARAGVAVTAQATGANPISLLPAKGSYKPSDLVGEHLGHSRPTDAEAEHPHPATRPGLPRGRQPARDAEGAPVL